MAKGDEIYFEKMITLTGYPEWNDFIKELENEIYQLQCNALEDADDYADLRERRGYAKALAYIVNFRDTIKRQSAIAAEQALIAKELFNADV